ALAVVLSYRASLCLHLFFFFHATPPPDIYPLSLTTLFRSRRPCPTRTTTGRAACRFPARPTRPGAPRGRRSPGSTPTATRSRSRSEEHTSELQSRENLVCRLLLEKKKKKEAKDTASKNNTK